MEHLIVPVYRTAFRLRLFIGFIVSLFKLHAVLNRGPVMHIHAGYPICRICVYVYVHARTDQTRYSSRFMMSVDQRAWIDLSSAKLG